MKQRKFNIQIIFIALLGLCLAACGKQADTDYETMSEQRMEDMAESENMIKEDEAITENLPEEEKAADTVKEDITTAEDKQASEQLETDDIITAYITEDIEYSDEAAPVQYVDDLSLLEGLKEANNTYAYQEGKVYYRKYHEDSYEETALWANYDFIPGTQKEIVCIDSDGKETELFIDEGYGDIYLINGRFYMTDGSVDRQLYSVDMQGNDRINYGDGEILVIDREKNIIILKMREPDGTGYYTLNYKTGEKKTIFLDSDDFHTYFWAYQDGWLYFTKLEIEDSVIDRLCVVSLEGEQREIIALTSDGNKDPYGYNETIVDVEVNGDRIYLIFGGYDGSAYVFQGGELISIKLDGTDYKAVATKGDTFYISHDNGNTLVYFPSSELPLAVPSEGYDTTVWDMDANTCRPSELHQSILRSYVRQMYLTRCYNSTNKCALCEQTLYDDGEEKAKNIYAISGDSGKVVRVVMDLGGYFTKWENEEVDLIEYENLYYADGFLYFTVKYSIWDEDTSIGWRDGYRRLRSEIYRLEIGKSSAQMLHSY